jgi:hypothetical protein
MKEGKGKKFKLQNEREKCNCKNGEWGLSGMRT